ncbi:MAG TPA: nuclear transport factor 2 family protein [Gemmatimonadales bacterium]|nr:nuclear transport factor 2 family protein [Gemmatimonadales bacterium]
MRRLPMLVLVGAALAAACAPQGGQPAVMATVDTAAAKTGIDSTRARYVTLQLAGDATGVAGLYTEDATLDLYGMPRQHGRAAIEAAIKGDYGMRKYTVTEITPLNVAVRTNEDASELGTYHDMHDAKGVKDHEWGRYVAGIRKGADGMWRLSYLMAFPDSTKVEK